MSDTNPLDDDLDALLIEPIAAPAAEASPPPSVDAMDTEQAAAILRDEIAEAKRKAIADAQLIPAPLPVPLHTVAFPVYDRKGGGFRLIERAFGTNELKVLTKQLLDALLSGDPAAATEPAHAIDATDSIFSSSGIMFPNRFHEKWKCAHSGTLHNPKKLTDSPQARAEFVNYIGECISAMHYNRGRTIASMVPGHEGERAKAGFNMYDEASIHFTPDAWKFYEDHAPFIKFFPQDGMWRPHVPDMIDRPPTRRDPAHIQWDFAKPRTPGLVY